MPVYNILINTDGKPDDESGIQKAVADHNVFYQPALALTVDEFLIKAVSDLVAGYTDAFFRAKADELGAKFEKANAATRQAVEGALASVL